jgi:phytoene/squalene synthetase
LQLTNHWQDVKRDLLERDRIYIPQEAIDLANAPDFESRLTASAKQGFGVDQRILGEFRTILRACVERTWTLYEQGQQLLEQVQPQTRPIIWLLSAGGQHVLRQIEMWNFETALHRPRLGKLPRVALVAKAWWMARRAVSARRSA